MAKISNENEILTQQVSEAKSKLEVCNSKCMSMEKEHDSLVSQIENLTSSKQIIQKTMSEEIVSIKNTLNGLRYEKSKCEEAIEIVKIENDKLRELVEKEQKRN